MADDAQHELLRLVSLLNDEDLFRRVIRGFSRIEAAFDTSIAGMLAEPIDGISTAGFTHKLNLAIGLGIIAPEFRTPYKALAKIRNDLAHGNREPEAIASTEFKKIAKGLMSPDAWKELEERLARGLPEDGWSKIALSLASSTVTLGGHTARERRKQEREALRRERDRQVGISPLIRAVLGEDAPRTNE